MSTPTHSATAKISAFSDNKWVVLSTIAVAFIMSVIALVGFLMEKSSVEAHMDEKIKIIEISIQKEEDARKAADERIWTELNHIDELQLDVARLQKDVEHISKELERISANQARMLERLDILIGR